MNLFRIIAIAAIFACAGHSARAEQALMVRDIAAEATGTTADDARNKAIADAQRQALKQLVQQQNLPADKADQLTDDAVSAMVTGFEVVSEKITAKSYKATFNITFNAKQLQAAFGGAPLIAPTATTSSAPRQTLVVPVLTIDGQVYLWEEPNPWREAWQRLQAAGQSQSILMPMGDLTDLSTVDRKAVINRDRLALSQLALRYGVDTVTLAEAELINQSDAVLLRGTLTQIAGDRPVPDPMSFSVRGKTLDMALFNGGVQDALQQLTGLRPDIASLATEEGVDPKQGEMKLLIPLQNSTEWVKIRQMFQGLPQVSDIRVIAITPNQADISLRYNGTPEDFGQAVGPQGYTLTQYEGYWVMHLPEAGAKQDTQG